MNIRVERLIDFAVTTLRWAGLNETDARTTAEMLVLTDTWGVFTHGTKNLRGYIRRLKGGGLRANASPRIESEGPSWAMVDADAAIGMVGSAYGMRLAIAKARQAGTGYVAVRNSCHFGAAGCYAWLAAEAGMLGIAMANDTPTMVAPGSRSAVLGSNPFSFAVPCGERHPLLLDMATSAVAGGKVFAAAAHGREIPPDWIVDSEGRPATDPRIFPQAGALVPMAGPKGYGLALLIETLSGVLAGASIAANVLSWSFAEANRPTDHGAAFIVLDLSQMMSPTTFAERMRELVRQVRTAPRAAGVDRIRLPGELEWERREQSLAHGIELPDDVVAPLKALSEESSVPLPAP